MKHFLYLNILVHSPQKLGRDTYTLENAILCDGLEDSFSGLTMVATEDEEKVQLTYSYVVKGNDDNPQKMTGELVIPFEETKTLMFSNYDFWNKKVEDQFFVFSVRPLENQAAFHDFMGHHIGPDERIRYYTYIGNEQAVAAEEREKRRHSGPPIAPLGSGVDPDILRDYVEEELNKNLD